MKVNEKKGDIFHQIIIILVLVIVIIFGLIVLQILKNRGDGDKSTELTVEVVETTLESIPEKIIPVVEEPETVSVIGTTPAPAPEEIVSVVEEPETVDVVEPTTEKLVSSVKQLPPTTPVFLGDMQVFSSTNNIRSNTIFRMEKSVLANTGVEYENVLVAEYFQYDETIYNKYYLANGDRSYQNFYGVLFLPDEYKDTYFQTNFEIYGDGALLYKFVIKRECTPDIIDIDIAGVTELEIRISSDYAYYVNFGLVDAYLTYYEN